MREIKFRGKSIDNGEWVYGNLTKQRYVPGDKDCSPPYKLELVIDQEYEGAMFTWFIIPETVGQYTGLTDKNGTKIFEGDIVNYFRKDYLNSETIFTDGCFMFKFLSSYTQKIRKSKQEPIFKNVTTCGEIIGNIHDNPELLKGGAE